MKKRSQKGYGKADSWIKVCNQMSSNSNQHPVGFFLPHDIQ